MGLQKVLLILESEDIRLALQSALESDYVALVANDATTGIALLREQPDALILDLLLPGMDGLTFLRSVSDFLPPTILVLTRYISPCILAALSDLGVDYVFRIPCPIQAIVNQLSVRL